MTEQRTNKRETKGTRDRIHEQEHGHDQRPHVLRRLCERVLQPSDRREDFGECDEDVAASLDPDVEI